MRRALGAWGSLGVGRLAPLALGLAGVLGACWPPVRDNGPQPLPLAAPTAGDQCAAEKLALSASAETLVKLGVEPTVAAAWLALRVGPDGIEGSEDDAMLDGVWARARLGESAMPHLVQWVQAHKSDPGVACGPVSVQLLAINDFHGNLETPTGGGGKVATPKGDVPAGGAAFLATWLETLAKRNPRTLIVSGGDNIGATPLISAAFRDEPTIEALSLMHLGVSTVGNHEFDKGLAELVRMQHGGCHPTEGCFGGDGFAGASFEYLAANVVVDATGQTAFPATTVRRFGKVRVGFIGMTLTGTKDIVAPTSTAGLSFLDEVATAKRYAAELHAQGVDAVVLLLHDGGLTTGPYDACVGFTGPLAELAPVFDPAIDVIVAAHTHTAHVCTIGGKLVTSAGHYGRLVTAIDLAVDEATGDAVSAHGENVIVARDVPPAPAVQALVERYRGLTAAVVGRIVGTIGADLVKVPSASGEIPMGSVIADAQLAASAVGDGGKKAPDAAAIAFMNPGGIRAELLLQQASSGEGVGQVTFGEVFTVQPFGNDLVTLTLTGAQIERLLEEQFVSGGKVRDAPRILQISAGSSFTWKKGPNLADRIDPRTVRIGGKALDLKASYRVVVNGFLATGGDGFTVFKEGTARRIGGVEVDALATYLAKHPGLRAPASGRIKIQ